MISGSFLYKDKVFSIHTYNVGVGWHEKESKVETEVYGA